MHAAAPAGIAHEELNDCEGLAHTAQFVGCCSNPELILDNRRNNYKVRPNPSERPPNVLCRLGEASPAQGGSWMEGSRDVPTSS